ncbi:MAG: hypothetical protein ACLQJR_02880 [Stellaceae bacterium]
MNKVLAMLALLVGLSACHVGVGIGDNGQPPAYAATDTLGSALAQASMGIVPATGD